MSARQPEDVKLRPGDAPERQQQRSGRLESLDALRGFDMFWIIGGAELFAALAEAAKLGWLTAISGNLTEHVEWEGFHFHDMIFPLFLFIMGVTTPFSIARRQQNGDSRAGLVVHVLRRTALLFLLGLIYSGLLEFPEFHKLRIPGVLQRLALASGCAALLYIFAGLRAQIAAAAALLLGYWAVMCWVPVPGHPPGSFTPEGNVANYVDRLLLQPGQMYESYGDPEGLLSTIPAITTALLGIFAGLWLRGSRPDHQKVAGLVAAGAAAIALGYAWSPWFPVVKKIWTSSYVLVAGGWSALLLAIFFWAIDVRGWRRWAYFFIVIGFNPITIYLGQKFIDFPRIARFFAGGLASFTGELSPVVLAVAVLAVKWLFLRYLYKQRIYLRV